MSDAIKYFLKNGLESSKELVEMGFGFCSLEDDLSFHTDQLKEIVDSYQLMEDWFNTNSVGLGKALASAKETYSEMVKNGILKHEHRYADRMVLKVFDLKQAIALVEQTQA